MGVSTTAKNTKTEQCKNNAQAKSTKKRQAAFEALVLLQQEGLAVTKAALAHRAGVSVVFLRSHPDLLQAIEDAEQQRRTTPREGSVSSTKDQVIAALRRRLEEFKQVVAMKESELRQKQREIDCLYGKLATNSPLTDAELQRQWQNAVARLARLENDQR